MQTLYKKIGNARGRLSDKDNRMQRLINVWQELMQKMETLIERGHGITETARCAYATLLMMDTGIRIGNESSAEGYICDQKHHADYGKQVKVYGLVTLQREHFQVTKNSIVINFLGKKAVHQSLSTQNSVLLHWFNSIDMLDHNPFFGINYVTLYKFIKRYVGHEFKPKDIRTAVVNIKYIHLIHRSIPKKLVFRTKREKNKVSAELIEQTAHIIGHTKGVCKKSYLSSKLIEYVSETILSVDRSRQ